MTTEPERSLPLPLQASRSLRKWIDFDEAGIVRMRTGKVELGQGIVTAIAQIAAEELDVAFGRIRPIALDTRASPSEGSTTGSRSIQEGGSGMRLACAEIRSLFLHAASRRLGVPVDSITVEDGTFRARDTDAKCSYWQLAADVDLDQPGHGVAAPKEPRSFKVVGQPVPRLDIEAKLRGGSFLQDIELPGMLHGRIVRPRSQWARLESIDESHARAMPGVREVVRKGSFVGVIAEREDQAIRAMQRLARDCRWEEPARLPDEHALPAWLREQAAEREVLCDDPQEPAPRGRELSATFTRPYIAHASIAPSCALGWWREGHVEFWSHSQSVFELRNEIARVLGLPAEKVVAHHAEGAGCYGQNGADDAALDALLLARAVPGAPVRVQWMREDEFAWEPLGPAMLVKLAASVSPEGRVERWHEEIFGNRHIGRPGRLARPALLAGWHMDDVGDERPLPVDMPLHMGGGSQRNAVPSYDFPRHVVNNAVLDTPLRVSALRALGAHLNVYAIESFMDELAHEAGVDPVEFRLRHLQDERSRAVVEAVARRAGWTPGRGGDGSRGTGIAFSRYKNIGTYAAVVAEIELGDRLRVKRIVAAVDCGCIVNPDGLRNQCEGGVIQAVSWALKEQMRFDRVGITSLDWEQYPILRFSEVPEIDIELIDRREEPSIGAGEGLTGPTGAAIANAVFNAIGVRVRDLPLTFDRIAAAIQAA